MENTIQDAEHFVTFYQDQDGNSFIGNRLFVARMLREYAKQLTISNHNSVSPEVVVPSEKRMNDLAQAFDELPKTKESKDTWECAAFKKGSRMTLSELRRLNPTMTFTELNHTAPTGDKSDEG